MESQNTLNASDSFIHGFEPLYSISYAVYYFGKPFIDKYDGLCFHAFKITACHVEQSGKGVLQFNL